LELLGICSLVTEENFTKTKSLNHFIDGKHPLRYINWNKKVEGRSRIGSPLTLNEDEYEDIVNSGNFFCRKVHPDTSRKLLAMLRKNITKE